MAALTTADVTLSLDEEIRLNHQKRNRVSLTFGDGSDTYPSGGVPLPSIGDFGMVTSIDGMNFLEPNAANGFVYKYDISAHTIRIYQGDNDNASDAPLIELTTSATPAATTVVVEAVGW